MGLSERIRDESLRRQEAEKKGYKDTAREIIDESGAGLTAAAEREIIERTGKSPQQIIDGLNGGESKG